MHATTVGVDLAKNVFQLAISEGPDRPLRRERLSRARFERFFVNFPPSRIVMEACGSANHWGRKLQALGHEVRLLHARDVHRYVRRNKTDAADAAALLEATRNPELCPVPVKTIEQQQLLQLHCLREQLKRTRTQRINLLRGQLREFGITIPQGLARGRAAIRAALEEAENGLPHRLRPLVAETLEEISVLSDRMKRLEAMLEQAVKDYPVAKQLVRIDGIGPLAATATWAKVGCIERFPSGRHYASFLGLTAREDSSAERRRLGRISKLGDTYLRTLYVHGARSLLNAAAQKRRAGHPLSALAEAALQLEARRGFNKATVALANKLARIVWATWRHGRVYDGNWARRTTAVPV